MHTQRKTFETSGPVDPSRNYVVPRTGEIASFIERIKRGRYTVMFAPRQTGKTTFFRWALSALVAEDETYFPIQLDFETFRDDSIGVFYTELQRDIRKEILWEFQRRKTTIDERFTQFLETYQPTDHHAFERFLEEIAVYLQHRKVVIIIDEFDGIPQTALTNFLYTLRRLYLSRTPNRCPYSVSIVGVKSIAQLNYDRSISPFNIQDDFVLPNFTLDQVRDLLLQYTEEVRQVFDPEVVEGIYKQTAGQPFLVNRVAQILTEEMDIPVEQTITPGHFAGAHKQILSERNVNISHLVTNIRRDSRFEAVLMRVCSYEEGIPFNLDNEVIGDLGTYGVLVSDSDGNCVIQNPIYHYRTLRAFQPLFNGLERDYHPEGTDTGFLDYLTADGHVNMRPLLQNFRDFIARAGYHILEVPDKLQEFIGQHLLYAYLDAFVRQVRGFMYVEVRTGRGRMDLIMLHKGEKYIVETKIWEGNVRYQQGKTQLAEYIRLEGARAGYYVVFDHRKMPQAWEEEDVIEGKTIISFCIPVLQERPSDVKA